jgi:hypothetical protein
MDWMRMMSAFRVSFPWRCEGVFKFLFSLKYMLFFYVGTSVNCYFIKYIFVYLFVCVYILYRYTPPEVHLGDDPSLESDVFSLSTLMWMINTLEVPFNELGIC